MQLHFFTWLFMNNLIWKYKQGLDLYEEFPIMETILFSICEPFKKTKVSLMCIYLGHRGQNLYLLTAEISLSEVGISDLREVLAALLLLSLLDEDFLFWCCEFWCNEFIFCDQNAMCKELKHFFHLVLPSGGIHIVLLSNPYWTRKHKKCLLLYSKTIF